MADYTSSYTGPEVDAAIGAVAGKEGALEIEAASGASVTAAVGKYYDFASSVGTLTFTLPVVSSTHIVGIIAHFTTSSSPAITITAAGNVSVNYYDGFSFEANTEYELDFLWNGSKWIVSYGVIE